MSISQKLERHLQEHGADFDLVPHSHSGSSMETAEKAHIPGNHLAKAVIAKEDDQFVMVVVPSDYHVHMGRLHHHLGHDVGLATERELAALFPDCDAGAVPPLGLAYGLRTLVDQRLLSLPEVYIESGDHETLLRMRGTHFVSLLRDAERVDVGTHI